MRTASYSIGAQLREAPARLRFAHLLAAHLAEGTRPSGPKKRWTDAEFAGRVQSPRANDYVRPTTVSNWRTGRALPTEIEAILRALFGPTTDEKREAREQLREAYRDALAEKHAAIISEARPDPAGGTW